MGQPGQRLLTTTESMDEKVSLL